MNDRGFLIVAQNNNSTDYIECARVLASSIRNTMPGESVSLLTDHEFHDPLFDNVIQFPHGDKCINDEWKLANDWQVYDATPYTRTLKIEADIYLPRRIDHWFDALAHRDLNICTTIRNYKNEISTVRDYRRTIDTNKLPDTYNALTYFQKSTLASEFYSIVRDIFENWSTYTKSMRIGKNEPATTDIVYAIAAQICGSEWCTMPTFNAMSMIHMKPAISNTRFANWTQELICEIHHHAIRINTFPQLFPLHYNLKSFAKIIQSELENDRHIFA